MAEPNALAQAFARAMALAAEGRNDEAAAAYRAVLAAAPKLGAGWINLAGVLINLSRFEEAASACERALALAPADARALNTRGVALAALDRPQDALASFDAALAADSAHVGAWINRGAALIALGRADDALESFAAALARDPGNAEALYYRAQAHQALNRRAEALADYDAALAHAPGDPDILYSKGVALLAFGDYRAGWPLFEERWRARRVRMSPPRDKGEPAWDGGAVDGVLRLWAEQGIGDEILHAHFIPEAMKRTPRVALECAPRLTPLFARAFPALEIGAAAPAAAQCPLGSLGRALDAAPDARAAPLLQADAGRRAEIRARYEALAGGRKIVGLSWFSKNAEFGLQKSAALGEWGALLTRGYFFVDLQYQSDAEEIAAAERAFGCIIHRDAAIDQVRDLDALAAQIAALDLLVSVSNSAVHMAGALGAPCVLLAPPGRGLLWYWGAEGETAPFYRSVRIVRRPLGAPWRAQIEAAADLAARRLG